MINTVKAYLKRICKDDVSLIENYEKAINDTEHMWILHHRDEVKTLPSGITVYRSVDELKENGRYWHCPANELIFMTREEHYTLHNANPEYRKKLRIANKGLKTQLGKTPWNKGLKGSDYTSHFKNGIGRNSKINKM